MTCGVFDLNVQLIACSVSPLVNWPVVNIEQFRYFNLMLCLDVEIKTSCSNLLSPVNAREAGSLICSNIQFILVFCWGNFFHTEIEKRSNLLLDQAWTISAKIFCFINFPFSIESLHPKRSPNARASWIIPLHIFVSPKPTPNCEYIFKAVRT